MRDAQASGGRGTGATPPGDARGEPQAPSAPPGEIQQRLAYDRTFLANERTYAAWLRTGLAIAAGGIAVAHLVPEPSRDSLLALALGTLLVLTGGGVMGYGARQFIRTAEALTRESGRTAPAPIRVPYMLTAVVGILLLAALLFLWSHQGRARSGAGTAVGRTADAGRVDASRRQER